MTQNSNIKKTFPELEQWRPEHAEPVYSNKEDYGITEVEKAINIILGKLKEKENNQNSSDIIEKIKKVKKLLESISIDTDIKLIFKEQSACAHKN